MCVYALPDDGPVRDGSSNGRAAAEASPRHSRGGPSHDRATTIDSDERERICIPDSRGPIEVYCQGCVSKTFVIGEVPGMATT